MKRIFMAAIIITTPACAKEQECSECACSGRCCPTQKTCNPVQRLATEDKNESKKTDPKEIIQQAYGAVAQEGGCGCANGGCCGGGSDLSQEIGYTRQELETFSDANLGLGCGHPVGLAHIQEGDVVVDLGSGAGLDCFLSARKVGKSGKVIGVDMTQAMLKKARENAQKYHMTNVEFRLGDIEALPIADNSVDIVISNCVINLAPNKNQVFKEAYRVLKAGGKMVISDVVLLKDLSDVQKNDSKLLCACVSGAILKDEYIAMLKQVGFDVTILDEDTEINTKWFGSDELPISSLKFAAYKK
jgi:SAM-dependent methyltransferase